MEKGISFAPVEPVFASAGSVNDSVSSMMIEKIRTVLVSPSVLSNVNSGARSLPREFPYFEFRQSRTIAFPQHSTPALANASLAVAKLHDCYFEQKIPVSKILIIEDDRLLLDVVSEWLTSEHHQVEATDNGREGLLLLDASVFDVILLDWELPELSGVEIVKAFRARGGVTPVIMFTKRSAVEDKLSGLDTGCDDYLTKPFELKELSARIRAVLRRPHSVASPVLKAGNLELDPITHVLKKEGVEVSLLPKEFSLLEFFMRNPDQVFNAEALITRVWSSDAAITDEAVGATIWRLRKKIDGKGKPSFIRTVYGFGYRFQSELDGN